jgi:hypothetical protein
MLALITAAGSSGGSSIIGVSCPVSTIRYYNHLSDLIVHWSTSAPCWHFECVADAPVFHCRMTSEKNEKSRRAALLARDCCRFRKSSSRAPSPRAQLFQGKVNIRHLSTFGWFMNPLLVKARSMFTIWSFVISKSGPAERRFEMAISNSLKRYIGYPSTVRTSFDPFKFQQDAFRML